jgi:hypothetical protein
LFRDPDRNVRIAGSAGGVTARRHYEARALHPGDAVSTRIGHALAFAVVTAGGCGFGQLQTARTTPAGMTQATIGGTFVSSGFENGRKPPSPDPQVLFPPAYVPPHFELRHGLTDNVDIGARLTFGIGFTGDVKVNLLPVRLPLAIAVSAGAGPSVSLGEQGIYILHVPVTLSASYDLGALTPYAGVGCHGVWMWGTDDPTRPDYNYTAPTGRGEGFLTPVGGLAIGRAGGPALLIEYGRLVTLWHDPGHGYTFVPAHMFSMAFRTGRGAALAR